MEYNIYILFFCLIVKKTADRFSLHGYFSYITYFLYSWFPIYAYIVMWINLALISKEGHLLVGGCLDAYIDTQYHVQVVGGSATQHIVQFVTGSPTQQYVHSLLDQH